MATSHTMSTNNSYIKYRIITTQNSQNVSANTSSVNVKVQVWRTNNYTTYGSGTVYVNINGSSYSANIGPRQRFTYNSYTEVFNRNVTIRHNNDGSKTFSTSARISHSQFSSSTQSFNTTLSKIPRSSTVPHFSFYANLKPNTTNWIDLGSRGIVSPNSSFRHRVWLMDGGTTLYLWDNIPGGERWLDLTGSQVNSLINRSSDSVSKTYTLWVQTTDGVNGNYIGNRILRNAVATIDSSVVPSVSTPSVSIYGYGKDYTLGKYIQGITKVSSSVSGSAGMGATIRNYRIYIRRVSQGSDSQLINGRTGTTERPITLSGQYEAYAEITDSRGRVGNNRRTFTVSPYSIPLITDFKVYRASYMGEVIIIRGNVSATELGGRNSNNYKIISKRTNESNWNTTSQASGVWGGGDYHITDSNSGFSTTSSYDFKLIVTDYFGNETSYVSEVPTAKTVLDINKNLGVGIGKMHEKGELDVAGDAYFEGNIELAPKTGSARPGFKLLSNNLNGHGYLEFFGSDNKRKAYIGIPNNYNDNLNIYNENNGDIRFLGNNLYFNGSQVIDYGSNSYGDWIKLYDGTMIAWYGSSTKRHSVTSAWGPLYYGPTETWTYPVAFKESPRVFAEYNKYDGDAFVIPGGAVKTRTNSGGFYLLRPTSASIQGNIDYLAIGRWK